MKAGSYNFKDHQSGSTFDAKTFRMQTYQGVKDITGASIVMTLVCGSTSYVFSTATGELEIINTTDFRLKKQIISLPSGKYKYDITFTFTNGDVKKYIKGHWNIL